MRYGEEKRVSRLFASTQLVTEQDRPVCSYSEQCSGCPYPRHGVICWHRDGSCLRTDMEEIEGRRQDKCYSKQ